MKKDYSYFLVDPSLRTIVSAVLSDSRGWKSHGFSFTETPDRASADIVIALLDDAEIVLRFGPTFSGLSVCSTVRPAEIALNKDNWMRPPPTFASHLPPGKRLRRYRAYAVNHEIGHAIGIVDHSAPATDLPCDVMYQQTRGTDGICGDNPWPDEQTTHVDASRFAELPPATTSYLQGGGSYLQGGGSYLQGGGSYLQGGGRGRQIRGPRGGNVPELPLPRRVSPRDPRPTQMNRAEADLFMRILRDRYNDLYNR